MSDRRGLSTGFLIAQIIIEQHHIDVCLTENLARLAMLAQWGRDRKAGPALSSRTRLSRKRR